MTKPTRTPTSSLHKRWDQILEKQRRSGLSGAAFCRENDLPLLAFYAWRRMLQAEGARPEEHTTSRNASATSAFLPIEIRTEERAGLEVVAADGWRLCFREVPDMAEIAALLRFLRGGDAC